MKHTPEQSEFRDLLRRFFTEKVTSEYLRARIASNLVPDAAFQQELDALGIFQGFADTPPIFSFEELGIVAFECGYSLVPEPLADQLIATAIASQLLSDQQRQELARITGKNAASTGKGGLAYPECCTISLSKDNAKASGSIAWGIGMQPDGWCIAFATTPRGRRLIAFSLSSPGVTISRRGSIDLTTILTSVELKDVPVLTCDAASTLQCEDLIEGVKASEVSGICHRVVSMSVEYAKTRQQFGVPIGSFQAIQHKLADCFAKSEALASLSTFALWSFVRSPEQRHLTSKAVALEASRVGPAICEAAIQAHGGIGFTWEYDLHLYLRRAKLLQSAFGISEDRASELLKAIVAT